MNALTARYIIVVLFICPEKSPRAANSFRNNVQPTSSSSPPHIHYTRCTHFMRTNTIHDNNNIIHNTAVHRIRIPTTCNTYNLYV